VTQTDKQQITDMCRWKHADITLCLCLCLNKEHVCIVVWFPDSAGLEKEEEKLKQSVKAALKRNDKNLCVVLSKQLLMSQKTKLKISRAKMHLKLVESNLNNQLGKLFIRKNDPFRIIIFVDGSVSLLRGPPFMTSTRREERGQAQVDACGRGKIGTKPHVDVHKKKIELESTDVILSSSHAKKLASFLPEFRLWAE